MLTALRRTPELHNLLDAVAKGNVVHHSGTCGAWPMGWSWGSGGHMGPQTQSDVDTLWHAQLITFDVPPKACGNACILTFDGSARLAEWNAQWSAKAVRS
jgi:hypothetical protein